MDAENWRLNMKLNKRICPKSFVVNGDRLVSTGNTREAAKEVNEGLKYYSNKVINALNPYAAADAGIIDCVCHSRLPPYKLVTPIIIRKIKNASAIEKKMNKN